MQVRSLEKEDFELKVSVFSVILNLFQFDQNFLAGRKVTPQGYFNLKLFCKETFQFNHQDLSDVLRRAEEAFNILQFYNDFF